MLKRVFPKSVQVMGYTVDIHDRRDPSKQSNTFFLVTESTQHIKDVCAGCPNRDTVYHEYGVSVATSLTQAISFIEKRCIPAFKRGFDDPTLEGYTEISDRKVSITVTHAVE